MVSGFLVVIKIEFNLMSLFERIKAIVKGWYYVYKDYRKQIRPELKELFDARLEVCNSCELKKFGTCTLCGCVVRAKTKVTDQHCPDNRWKPHIYSISSDRDDDDGFIIIEEVPTLLQPLFAKRFGTSASVDDWEEFLNGLET